MQLTTSYQLISSFNLTYGAIRTYAKYSSQSTTDNTTTYQIKQVYYYSPSGGYIGFDSATAVLDGTQKQYNSYTRMYSGENLIQEVNRTITHNQDGSSPTKNIATSWTASFGGSGSTNANITFPNIARYPIVTDATNFNDEQNPTLWFTTNIASGSSVSAYIQNSAGTYNYIIRDNISISNGYYTFVLTEAERNILRNATPNSNSMNVRFTLRTTLPGNTDYWSFVEKTLSIVNANPSFLVAYQDTNGTTTAITSDNQKIIQNKSTLQINITSAAATKGASLSSAKVTISGATTTKPISSSTLNIDIGAVNLSTNTSIPVVLTDSRGNTSSVNVSLSILPYQTPSAIVTLNRKLNYYTQTDIKVDTTYSSLDGNNTMAITYRYKKTSDNTWSNYYSLTDGVTSTFNADNLYAWDVQVLIQDALETRVISKILSAGQPPLYVDVFKNSVGVNCFPDGSNTIEVNGKDISNTYSTNEMKIGTWIDNKPIYRKVVDLGTLPNANTITISSGINEQIYPLKIYGIATKSDETFPLPFAWGDTSNVNNYCGIFYSRSTNNVWFRTNRDMSQYTGFVIIEYRKMNE